VAKGERPTFAATKELLLKDPASGVYLLAAATSPWRDARIIGQEVFHLPVYLAYQQMQIGYSGGYVQWASTQHWQWAGGAIDSVARHPAEVGIRERGQDRLEPPRVGRRQRVMAHRLAGGLAQEHAVRLAQESLRRRLGGDVGELPRFKRTDFEALPGGSGVFRPDPLTVSRAIGRGGRALGRRVGAHGRPRRPRRGPRASGGSAAASGR